MAWPQLPDTGEVHSCIKGAALIRCGPGVFLAYTSALLSRASGRSLHWLLCSPLALYEL